MAISMGAEKNRRGGKHYYMEKVLLTIFKTSYLSPTSTSRKIGIEFLMARWVTNYIYHELFPVR